MESVFDMAAGLTDAGLGENISQKDKEFIKLYYGGSGLVECANYYAKRFNDEQDYFACFIVAEFCYIQGGFAKAVKYYGSICVGVNSETKSVFRHIDGRELKLDWRTLKPIVAESCRKLGKIYNDGALKDYAKAAKFFKQGCDLGDAECYRALGFLCEEGNGVAQSCEKAIEFYQKAIALGNAEAYCSLGFLYEEGRGVAKDYNKAVEFYQKAKDFRNEGEYLFEVIVAYWLWRCKLGLQKSHTLVPNAMGICYSYYSRHMYSNGQGVEKDNDKALELYKKAADMGYAGAYRHLGIIYEEGEGVEKDNEKAYRVLRASLHFGWRLQ